MAVTIVLPADVERRLRADSPDLDAQAKEALAIDLFQRGKLSHFELSTVLGLDRYETDACLKRHNVVEGSLTMRDLDEQAQTLDRVLGPAPPMLVIADSSPIIVLVNIGHIDVLPKLFGQVVIPPAVAGEIGASSRPQAVREFAAAPPPWLKVQRPAAVQRIPELHPGESEAISLAIELRADLVLIDERRAYREAIARKLNAVGTVRVLERAATEGLLELAETFERLKRTDFWISHKLLDERLRLFNQQGRDESPG